MSRSSSLLTWLLVSLSLSGVWAQSCVLTIPANPLTPAVLSGTGWTVTGCIQSPIGQGGTATFVQAVILDMDTGNLFTYTPLVLSAAAPNNVAAIAPTPLTFINGNTGNFPVNYIAALTGGTNGGSTTLAAANVMVPDPMISPTMMVQVNSLEQAGCVNGGGNQFSTFGQYFCCNCAPFLAEVHNLIVAGKITQSPAGTTPNANQIPALGLDSQQNTCPTTHDFSIVDQDQEDNVPASYLFVTATGTLAQDTVPNRATLTSKNQSFMPIDNGSDNDLITLVQAAIGCTPYTLKDLADPTGATFFATSISNTLQSLTTVDALGAPRAFMPNLDPMTLNAGGTIDVAKLNAYRASIGENPVGGATVASTKNYCTNLYVVGAPRIVQWLPILVQVTVPDFGAMVSNTLGGLLVGRYMAAAATLGCNGPAIVGGVETQALGLPDPFTFAGFTFGAAADGMPLICPATVASIAANNPTPFNPQSCVFTSTTKTLQQVLGVTTLVPINTEQTSMFSGLF